MECSEENFILFFWLLKIVQCDFCEQFGQLIYYGVEIASSAQDIYR